MSPTLTSEISLAEKLLHDQLDRAVAGGQSSEPGEVRAVADAFLIATSQHLAAVVEVMIPEVRRRLGNGDYQACAFLRKCRRLEHALVMAKAKLYGDAQFVTRPWAGLWVHVRDALDGALAAERALAAQLDTRVDYEGGTDLAERLWRRELRSPTRPHPRLPHRGVAGRIARRLCSATDRLWDELEGRVVPARQPDSRAAVLDDGRSVAGAGEGERPVAVGSDRTSYVPLQDHGPSPWG